MAAIAAAAELDIADTWGLSSNGFEAIIVSPKPPIGGGGSKSCGVGGACCCCMEFAAAAAAAAAATAAAELAALEVFRRFFGLLGAEMMSVGGGGLKSGGQSPPAGPGNRYGAIPRLWVIFEVFFFRMVAAFLQRRGARNSVVAASPIPRRRSRRW